MTSSRSWKQVGAGSGLKSSAVLMLLSSALCASHGAEAQFRQQGPKLVGTGAVLNGYGVAQGNSVAISGDGNTAIVGGPEDNAKVGAVWAFTRSGGVWIQQGPKLVGSGAVQSYSGSQQGYSVAISGDGNTAIVGGPSDAFDVGSVWVFTRSGDVWSQQGPKLTGVADNGSPNQGRSVAISADGNTAIVGGPNDEFDPSFGRGYIGATWVFTRSSGGWTQQGPKLVATQSDGPAYAWQGYSVAIAADGNTAIVGGPGLREYLPPCPPCNLFTEVGAAWVFTRSGGSWTQQAKVMAPSAGVTHLGSSVAISADGNTAMVGADTATWVFTRSGGVWTQQGGRLIAAGAILSGLSPAALSLSADGNIAIVRAVEGAWVFGRNSGVWTQQGDKLVGEGGTGEPNLGSSVAISGDGRTVILGGPGDTTLDNGTMGAAWVFYNAALAAVDVPMLSQWVTGMMSVLLGVCAAVTMRRHEKRRR